MKRNLKNNNDQCLRMPSGLLITYLLFFLFLVSTEKALGQKSSVISAPSQIEFLDPLEVSVDGILGEAILASQKGRLVTLPDWNNGELIKMFSKESKMNHHKTDWYGEHAGKWLYSTARAARQSGDKELKALLVKTADYLINTQEPDGYLGVYSPKIRITNTEASHLRSWDAWNLSYLTLGLLEVHRYFPNQEYLNAAKKVGELLMKTFGDGSNDITEYGTRHGISATIILDPVVELYKVTGDKRYLDFAEVIIKKIESKEGVRLISVALNHGDMENVGDGKAYQLLWNLTAIAKLYEVTGNQDYLNAVRNAWQNIADHHLTITGGPWGGVGKHLECFNRKNFWNPYGFIETCSIMSWIQLNKEMLHLTGEAKYAQEIEKSAYNALLGAQFPNGKDWSYHSFSNGRRHIAHFNDCCPSSGALALEELSPLIYSRKENGITCNLYTASEATVSLNQSNPVRIIQKTNYPFDGNIQITLSPSKKENFPLFIRIPDWVGDDAKIRINGKSVDTNKVVSGEFFRLDRIWQEKDVIEIEFPLELKVHNKVERAGAPQGGPDLYRVNWFAVTQGPLVFAADGLINGNDRERALQLPEKNQEGYFSPASTPNGYTGPAFELKTIHQERLLFLPYYEAGGRTVDTWRLTWLQNRIENK